MDYIQTSVGKVAKERSRKPTKKRLVKKVVPTEEELDYMKYVGNL